MIFENTDGYSASKQERGEWDLIRECFTEMMGFSLLVIDLSIPPKIREPKIKKIIRETVGMGCV